MIRFGRVFAAASVVVLAAASAGAQVVAEWIGEGISQFHASAEARAARLPSFALLDPPAPIDRPGAARRVTPRFSTAPDGRFVTEIPVEPGTSLYGTGEAAGPLLRNGRVTEAWNLDAYGYQDNAVNLYTAHPWVLAVRADGSSFGVLADTTYRVEMDLREGIAFRAHGPAHPVLVIERDHPRDVVAALGALTGTIEMPPRWAIGYHQCRYSYNPDERVLEVARGFRERSIPADVIWMDIDYMDGYRVFTFDKAQFPDPARMNRELERIGFSNVWMIDPGVKAEEGYFVFDQGTQRNAWVQRADGTTYVGDVWPGACVFPDFTAADVRAWWASLYTDFMALGIDGVWNDMNEPAVFNVQTKTMPEDNHHRADSDLGGPGPHARYHNVYGMLMVQASREGIVAANPQKRPFVLSRANFIGGHRYGATWTGDNTANWYHVDVSIPMTLNLGLSGQAFCGPDIGGFAANGNGEMFARWMGFGALLPFARAHTGKGNIDKEPWSFGEAVEATCRRAIERRYRLLPLYYTLFEESHRTGLPVARPLFFADPADPALRSEDDAFMLGDDLIVAADTTPARERVHTLPANAAWRPLDFPGFDGAADSTDPDQPRLFVRSGGIIPTGPVHQHFGDRPDQRDELTLVVALDDSGRAEGTLYEDEGEGWAFRDGAFRRTRFDALSEDGVVTVTSRVVEGTLDIPGRSLVARVLLPDGREVTARGREGTPLTVRID